MTAPLRFRPRTGPLGASRLALALSSAVLGLTLAATPALADRRIEEVAFDADRIAVVHGQSNIQTMIEFAPDERIENIALGDSAAWQVTPNKRGNLLFLKPFGARAHTNMTVVTDQRRYLFDLVSAGAKVRPVYVLRFVYPPQLELPMGPAEAPALTPGTPAMATTPSPAPVAAASPAAPPHNTAWRVSGDRQLLPSAVSDDGQSTFLAWDAAQDLPAILATGPDGREGPVNFTVRDGTIVIDGVAPRYVLRIGKASALLVRLGSPETSSATPKEPAP